MIDKELAEIKREFLEVYRIPSCVKVDESFPMGSIECYTLPRIKGQFSDVVATLPFYITLSQLIILDDKRGKGTVYGRVLNGFYCRLNCEFYRVRYVIKLSESEQEAYRKFIYEED